jgi:hypothetical protein
MMVMALKHVEITKEGFTRWFHKLRKNLYIKNSIYFALLVHLLEEVHFCTPDDALVVRNILSQKIVFFVILNLVNLSSLLP